MRTLSWIQLLVFLATSVSTVASLQVSIPENGTRRCGVPVTITRDADDPTEFALSYVEPSGDFQEFVADVTDTAVTPTTVVFIIATPGVFYVELSTDETAATPLATSGTITLDDGLTCP
ncbi:hypothetical protein EV361DRAFT_66041 [Lentinula raphanica]|uniref:Uncharacterized protein n=1 Tax=Lentinula raphanica TaxID=153919 RepID=A0AA38UM14_9AGAR|nr:hypothetical protein FB446DRAFT_752158 [Lentinula raphanica]KAJ3822911.1 hypothetical protein F5880DRAFT_1570923 [Lentinula raphanica]KAJ3843632.1 hypothetical protein F5878DRAFT_251003 [Lentinula raphanica]KAJ3973381.1 hypothetical protein EV361DRAFT_66041 [Lentinula raphanica]